MTFIISSSVIQIIKMSGKLFNDHMKNKTRAVLELFSAGFFFYTYKQKIQRHNKLHQVY